MVSMFQIDFESIALAGVNDLIQVYGFDGVDIFYSIANCFGWCK